MYCYFIIVVVINKKGYKRISPRYEIKRKEKKKDSHNEIKMMEIKRHKLLFFFRFT